MADEHNAWLDKAAADELLCPGTGPVASGADPRARAEAARLRAALDALTPSRPGVGELPGEAAAVADPALSADGSRGAYRSPY
ncbi:hypothetical protein ACEPPI_22215, partial [Streptomyces sp. AB3(2024)]